MYNKALDYNKDRKVLLYSGTPSSGATVNLNDSLTNYKGIMVAVWAGNQWAVSTFPFDVIDIFHVTGSDNVLNTNIVWYNPSGSPTPYYLFALAVNYISNTSMAVAYVTTGQLAFNAVAIYGIR